MFFEEDFRVGPDDASLVIKTMLSIDFVKKEKKKSFGVSIL